MGEVTKAEHNFNLVIEQISDNGLSLRQACESVGMHRRDFHNYVNDNKEASDRYARAREDRTDLLFDKMFDIANHTEEDHTPFTGANVVNRDRLRIDAYKWALSKMDPKKYGDKLDVQQTIVTEPRVFKVD